MHCTEFEALSVHSSIAVCVWFHIEHKNEWKELAEYSLKYALHKVAPLPPSRHDVNWPSDDHQKTPSRRKS